MRSRLLNLLYALAMAPVCVLALPAPLCHAAEAGREPLSVTVIDEPWSGPFSAAALATALRLRLPSATLTVGASPQATERLATDVQIRWLDGPRRGLRVERATGEAVEFPIADSDDKGTSDPKQVLRRAALVISIFADEATPIIAASPQRGESTSHDSLNASVGPIGTKPGPPVVTPGTGVGPSSPTHWAVSAQIGPAFAVESDEITSTMALTLHGRRYVSPHAAIEMGVKLAGEFLAKQPSQVVGVADRAFFAGAAYEAWLSHRTAIDVSGALQYTYPQIDVDGEGIERRISAPASTRFAVRTGIGVVWLPAGNLTLGISAATSFAFREREYVDETNQEAIGVGSMILDLAAGGGVRW